MPSLREKDICQSAGREWSPGSERRNLWRLSFVALLFLGAYFVGCDFMGVYWKKNININTVYPQVLQEDNHEKHLVTGGIEVLGKVPTQASAVVPKLSFSLSVSLHRESRLRFATTSVHCPFHCTAPVTNTKLTTRENAKFKTDTNLT